jgi:hypothetical protein
MKDKSPASRSFQLRVTIKQATELAKQKCVAFDRELTSIQAEIGKAREMALKAKEDLANGNAPKNLASVLKGKKQFLQMKLQAVLEARDAAVAAKDSLVGLHSEGLHEEQRGLFERMHGLLSYGIATGQSTPDCQLLFDTLGDYLEAKTDGDRKAAHRAVDLIFQHGNLGDKRSETAAGDRILAQLDEIRDPEEQSRIYAQHRDEIHQAFDRKPNI